ncbi:MAG: hypothetical protein IJ518_08195 [Clostridia bacterium]|nr:hypothetical protein [Clostridia bacterium]
MVRPWSWSDNGHGGGDILCGGDSATTTTTTTTTASAVPDGLSFTATVADVGEGWLLVEADEGGFVSGTVRVLFEQAPSVAVGDRVTVWHSGQMMPSLPPQLVAVAIEKLS